MADELLLPQVPEAKPDDNEDVSWALSTAEAMWARGDHADGIKWLRKAAEAASDADQDMRALELAKAASDLAGVLARRSAASAEEKRDAAPPTPRTVPSSQPTAPTAPTSSTSVTSQVPVAPPTPQTSSARPSASASGPPKRSAPPLPPRASHVPSPPSSTPSKPPRPLATSGNPPAPAHGRGVLSNSRVDPKKNRRRSREDLADEAASVPGTTFDPRAGAERETSREIAAADTTTEVPSLALLGEGAAPSSRGRRRSRPDGHDRLPASSRRSAAEWDASPTHALTGEDMEQIAHGDRMTSLGAPPVAPRAPTRPPTKTVHDEEIQTSQAVRVVVWRDGDGVHVAPAGTVVTAITVDAVLVALEPGADLTAWLSRRER